MGSNQQQSRLFEPLQVGSSKLQNRIALAPLTRLRAEDDHTPIVELVKEYYAQRSAAPGTLLITEATIISEKAGGFGNAPGIYTDSHVKAWKEVVDGVHAKGGIIYAQLWSQGRVAQTASPDPNFKHDIVSASDIPVEGGKTPRPLTEAEIQEYVQDFATAAKRAIGEAGFDGVEIHSANGYLPDQFIQDVTNKRTDKYGGSVENRARFSLEITKAIVDAIGADRTAIRLSPWSRYQNMKMDDPVPQFSYLTTELNKLNLSYIHFVDPRIDAESAKDGQPETNAPFLKIMGDRPVLIAGGLDAESAKTLVDKDHSDQNIVVVFGRHFIANPDIVFRIQNNIEFNKYDRDTFYLPKSPKGYVDYPFSEEYKQAKL